MKRIKTGISIGDTIELGEELHMVELLSSHGTQLRCLSEGPMTEYVALAEKNVDHGDEIDLHEQARILGFVSGNGIMSDSLYFAVPKSIYGEDE